MKKYLYVSVLTATLLTACVVDTQSSNVSEITEPDNQEVYVDAYPELQSQAMTFFGVLPAVAENPKNPVTDEKVELGKKLYFDKILSKDQKQSCNTCHNVNSFGVDNNPFSEGNDGTLGGRNSPTTFNAALHVAQFWDGREPDVEAQAGGPVLNPVEMAMPNEKAVVDRLKNVKEYQELFAKAFPDDQDPVNFENMKKAIGAYERKLITPSKFDDYIAGDAQALTDEEKEGLKTFIDVGCTSCHSGATLGGTMFQKFGTFGNYWEATHSEKIDNGRFDVTGNEADKYMFKVPSLRNVEKTYPYFHDGSVADLNDAIKIMGKLQLNKDLTEQEINSIATFLKTLTADIPQELKP